MRDQQPETFFMSGEKVCIREKRLSDAEEDHSWRCDPELARLDAAAPLRMEFQEFLRQFKRELEYPSAFSRRLGVDTHDGVHIGNCMYYDMDYFRGTAELGILLGNRDFWGGGYGTEAVQLLLYHMFTAMPIKRVYLHTLDFNHRAQRSFEKCGFKIIRPVKRSGWEFFYMELKRERWVELQQEAQARDARKRAQEASS